MPTKTISIDIEAYDRLKRVQREGESFSQTIKRVVHPPADVQKLLRAIRSFSPKMMEAVEEQVRQRRAPRNLTDRGR